MYPRSIAGVRFDSVRRFRATLLLRTTCMRPWCDWVANCVAASQTKHQKKSHQVGIDIFPTCIVNSFLWQLDVIRGSVRNLYIYLYVSVYI